VDNVQVVKKVPQSVGAKWPGDDKAVHVTDLAERLVASLAERHFLEDLRKELTMTWDNGEPKAMPSICS
jgi:hypothetical protein